MNRILRDPLVHFLALGAALFALFELVATDESAYDNRVIVVDHNALMTFVQYRTRAFEPQAAAARLASMSEEELELLIDDYVREEALHREAKALGLDQTDYVIKRRMIQSVEFITDGFVSAAVGITDEEIAAHYEANREDYYVGPVVTFTHVYFDSDGSGRADAHALAKDELEELNTKQVTFHDAPSHGDRFPFFVNYVERDRQFVASHFGAAMAQAVFGLEPSESTWHGPFKSQYGQHLVMLSKKTAGRNPTLAEIRDVVREDALREKTEAQKGKAIQAIVDAYDVRRTYERPVVSQAMN